MGVGKSTTAEAVAAELGCPHSDSDAEIRSITGVPGIDVAQRLGVPALHQLERAVLIAALARVDRHVITAAASVVESDLIRELLSYQTVVMIDADLEVIHRRQADGDHRRPMSPEELQALAVRRAPLFAEVADLEVDGANSTETLAAEILAHVATLH
jgi:shikimate kinase